MHMAHSVETFRWQVGTTVLPLTWWRRRTKGTGKMSNNLSKQEVGLQAMASYLEGTESGATGRGARPAAGRGKGPRWQQGERG